VGGESSSDGREGGARLWKVFGDVRPGEGRHVALFGLQIFLLLTAY